MAASRTTLAIRPRALQLPRNRAHVPSSKRWEHDWSKLDQELIAKNMEKQPLKGEWMRTGRVPYPKHVWSPTGGWYSEPANWKRNTAITWVFILGVSAVVFNISAELEERNKMPDPDRFFPSRYWSRQIIEHEKAEKAKKERESSV